MIYLFKIKKDLKNKGFTIFELLISLSIFAIMSALLLSKYGTFNQGILLTNLAYDIALTLRNAQYYGLNTKSPNRLRNDFKNNTYGVHFETNPGYNQQFIFFVDKTTRNSSQSDSLIGVYDKNNISQSQDIIQVTNIKRGSKISRICPDEACSSPQNVLDISFTRPNPNAIIKYGGGTSQEDAIIIVESSDGSTRKIIVNSTGQISVK